MEKILFIIAVFLITSCVAILKAKDFKETWKFAIKWVFGLFALFALNLFNEAFFLNGLAGMALIKMIGFLCYGGV